MRVANSPDARLGEQVSAALFLNHPYGRPVIGWRKEIEKLSREDALAFYHRFYAPNNAIVVVAGDVNADEVKKLAEDTYGKVERRPDVGPRVRPQEPEPVAVRHVMLADPRAAQPSLQRSYLVPCEVKAKPGEAEALDLLSHILGNGQNSRLYRELVEDKRVAVNAGTNYQGTSVDDTTFSIYATPRPGVSLEELESAIDGVIAELVDAGITATELERAKTRMIADAVYARDSQATMARWYGSSLAVGETIEQVQGWPDRVRAVDAEAVRNAARTWLTKQRSVTGYLVKELPAEGDKKAANGDKREKKT
jgi:zinc protease